MTPKRASVVRGAESKGNFPRLQNNHFVGASDPRRTHPQVPQAPIRSRPPAPQAPIRSGPRAPHAPTRSGPRAPHAPTRSGPRAPQAPTISGPQAPQAPTSSDPQAPQALTRSSMRLHHPIDYRELLSSAYQTGKTYQGTFGQSSKARNDTFGIGALGQPSTFQHPVHEDREQSNEGMLRTADDLAEDDDEVEQKVAHEKVPPTTSIGRAGSVDGLLPIAIHRQFIEPVDDDSFSPYNIIRRIIPECVITCYHIDWTTVSTCDPAAREAWFEKFKQLFIWDSAKDTWVKNNFNKKVSKLLRNRWAYNRRKVGKTPILKMPEGIRLARERWEDPKWKHMQENNKKNSKGLDSKTGHSRHRMGAIPAHAAKQKLAIKLGREPTTREIYKRFKIMRDGTYLDRDGEQIMGRLDDIERRQCESNPDGTQYSQVKDIQTFAREVGVTRRGQPRLLGSAATMVKGTEFHRLQQLKFSDHSITKIVPTTQNIMERVSQLADCLAMRSASIQRVTELLMRALASRSTNSPTLPQASRSTDLPPQK